MAEERTHRRLAAIMAADVVGYSRLMEQDEVATLAALKQRRREILQPVVVEHHGRIVKVLGDGVLVEFASPVNAITCAMELQKRMAVANDSQPENLRILLRIGINLGDVMVEGGDLYGDGVNIAARLQTVAEPGGICVSAKVRDEVDRKLAVSFEDLGARRVKNVDARVHIYRVADTPAVTLTAHKPSANKPSIAVLPFANMSGDPAQEYFSDGIVEEIITALSRMRSLFVIARNSSFHYKGRSTDVRQIGRELGVRYVLEGSVQRDHDRVRISVQLIDAMTGAHRWAERYNREMKDAFAIQDEIALDVAGTLVAHVSKAEAERTLLKPPASWQSHDFYMRASDAYVRFHRRMEARTIYETRRLLDQCLRMDPGFARAHVLYSSTLVSTWALALDDDHLARPTLERAHQRAE